MKSICLVVQNVYDIDPRVRRKAEALVAAGYSVDVLALQPPDGRLSYVLNGVNVKTMGLGKRRGSLLRYGLEYAAFFLWVAIRVPLDMRHRRYTVIDVNTLPDFLIFAPFVARWMGAKLVLDMHEITPEFYMSKYGIGDTAFVVRLLKFLEKISFQFADHVITINEPIRQLFIERGLRPEKTTVVMNSAEESRFLKVASGEGPAAGKFVMMYHGTLTRLYGLDLAIEALSIAQHMIPGAELWILGSGPESTALRQLAEERQCADKVKLVGQVAPVDIPSWVYKCDVGMLPIRRDVFLDFAYPNKLSEFIIAKKPVIISRLKAIQYYFTDDALAFFEPNRPEALAQQMIRLFGDHELRRKLAAQASHEHTAIRWDVMKERYVMLVGALGGYPLAATGETSIASGELVRQSVGTQQ